MGTIRDEEIQKYWLERYEQDKVGTIATLSQAKQHMAWLREWKRVHGDQSRVKPITKKVDGQKVKIGEADIAVPWSELEPFFQAGNEYGDVETVKFLSERIEKGDTSELSAEELHDLSERENVKWSDGQHSLNPFQGYLYDFTAEGGNLAENSPEVEAYGKYEPAQDYIKYGAPQGIEGVTERQSESAKAFSRYYTTRLLQGVIKDSNNSKYADFVNFDITSVTTPEQIEELDQRIAEMMQDSEIQTELEGIAGDAEYEKKFYDELKREVDIEIKKDSDRIENAHKIFVAFENGDLSSVLDDETRTIFEGEYAKN